MMRIWVVASLLAFNGFTASAQYYFQDIISSEKTSAQFLLLKKHNLKNVTATSIEADGTATENFKLSQELNSISNCLTTYSKSDFTGESVLRTYFSPVGKILLVVDSSASLINRTTYTYNAQGMLMEMAVVSNDTVQKYSISEKHLFTYNQNGQPSNMLRIKNNADTVKVVFVADENGKPGTEQWFKNNRKIDTWFYYYDAKGRITDVGRFNAKANRILPDFLFEYDEAGRLSQQTTVQAGSNQYRIWKYIYDSRGLKTKEGIFNKYKQAEGRIEYSYQ